MGKPKINAIVIDVPLKVSTFEFMCLKVSSKLKFFIDLIVYRTRYASCDFFAEFEEVMNIMSSYNEEVVVLGVLIFSWSVMQKGKQKILKIFSTCTISSSRTNS